MTTIVELPNEPKFTIKTVASQTGIRPVTLRAWERRHDVLTPHRAENHYRLYSERDIAILRWLKFRVDEGMSIGSAVSELRGMSGSSIWPETIPVAPTPVVSSGGQPPEEYAVRLARMLITQDENRAADLLREVHSRFNLMAVLMQVVLPAVQKVNEAWYRGEISASTERFANAYLRGKLLSLLQAYPSRHSAPLVLVGCAPMEVRELESLMMAVLLRSQGYRVEYLGPDINIDDLADYAGYEQPAMVILWANSEFTAREMYRAQDKLRKVRSMPVFAYAGEAFTTPGGLRKPIPGTYLGGGFNVSLDKIRDLLRLHQKIVRKGQKDIQRDYSELDE